MRRKNYRPGGAAQADFYLIAPRRAPTLRKKKAIFFLGKPFLFFLRVEACPESDRAKRFRSARRLRRRGLESPQRTNRQRRADPADTCSSSWGRSSGLEPRLRQCGAQWEREKEGKAVSGPGD